MPEKWNESLWPARKRILEQLAPFSKEGCTEDKLRSASREFLQRMYLSGLIDGAGHPDSRGWGNFKYTRVWWITDKGRDALKNDGETPPPPPYAESVKTTHSVFMSNGTVKSFDTLAEAHEYRAAHQPPPSVEGMLRSSLAATPEQEPAR